MLLLAGDVTAESLRKELIDIRRQLTDSNFEKEKYNSSNKELRDKIKEVESEKRDQARILEETYQKIAGTKIKPYFKNQILCMFIRYVTQINYRSR